MATEQPEPDWVRIEARASVARLHYGQQAIVDRTDRIVIGHLRAGHFVLIDDDPEVPR